MEFCGHTLLSRSYIQGIGKAGSRAFFFFVSRANAFSSPTYVGQGMYHL